MSLFANRYEIIHSLGYGTTGGVELVHDTLTGKRCALKLLRGSRGRGYSSTLSGFQKEFEILKEINHPNIARVYDAGYDNDTEKSYITTEYVPGKDLFKTSENLQFVEVEEMFVQTLRALNYLHYKKIYHLDIKPQNILVIQEDGTFTVKIIDFGFANFFEGRLAKKKLEEDADSVIIIGTPAYTAPEIISGDGHDGRTDLYSLGCVFYEALTRQLPFRSLNRNPGEVHQKHIHEKPRPPKELNDHIPDYFNDIILNLMEKDRAGRPHLAEDVIKEINLFKNKPYDIETPETRKSYLLESGTLIGRDKEKDRFIKYFNDRIKTEEYNKAPYLVITGLNGCGKSRFLAECKFEAQKTFGVDVITWSEFEKKLLEDIKTPCLVIGDDIHIEKHHITKLTYGFEDERLLAVLTTSQDNIPCEEENIIRLNYFSKDEVGQYVKDTVGIDQIEENIIEDLYKYTNGGCPLYLVQFLKANFANGYLIDSYGRWSDKVFNDIVCELKHIGFTDFIKSDLVSKIKSLNLDETHLDVLYMMALADKPTLTDIKELTCGHVIEEKLEFFVNEGILKNDPEVRFVFANPLYKEIFLEQMPKSLKEQYCDHIADHYEFQSGDEEKRLYFRGRGSGPESADCLLKLAKINEKNLNYNEAIDNLKELLRKDVADKNKPAEATLTLGEIYIAKGEYDKASKYLNGIIEYKDQIASIYIVRAYEQLGICCYRKKLFSDATDYYLKALGLIENKKDYSLTVANIKIRMAIIEIEQGHIEESERLSEEAFQLCEGFVKAGDGVENVSKDSDYIYYEKGEFEKAEALLKKQIAMLKDNNYLDQYPRALYKLGAIYVKMGRFKEGEKVLLECLDIVKQRKIPSWVFGVYNELGILSEKENNYHKANDFFKHAHDLAVKTSKSETNIFVAVFNLARSYVAVENLNEAKKHFLYLANQIELSKDKGNAGNDILIVSSYIELAAILRREQNYKESFVCLEKAGFYLKEKKYLKSYEQYYLQELALVHKAENDESAHNNILNRLINLKLEPWFNHREYEKWLAQNLSL
ncbi:MAG: protein kinase [Deltaproteobacteria bacterium]|nr:protein kinase [Deltaproteobacteria bacterium]